MNELMVNPVLLHLLRGAVWIAVCLIAGLVLRRTGLNAWLGRAAIGLLLVIAVVPLIPGFGVIELLRPEVPNAERSSGAISAEIVWPGGSSFAKSSRDIALLPVQINWAGLLVLGWAVGAGLVVARLIWGQLMLRRFSRETQVLQSPRWNSDLERLGDEVPAAKRVTLVTKGGVAAPVTWGVLRPRILVPEALVEVASAEEVDMVLRHELSHVRGWDCFFGLLGRVGLALNWVNPLAWLMDRWVARAREESADMAVLQGGHGRTEYAAFLVRMASGVHVGGAPVAAMARVSSVPGRVENILAGNYGRVGPAVCGAIFTVVVGVGLVLATTVIGEERVESGEVTTENNDSDLLETKTYDLPKDLQRFLDKPGDLMKYLMANKVAFGPGASAEYSASKQQLVVRNTRSNLTRIEEYFSLLEARRASQGLAEQRQWTSAQGKKLSAEILGIKDGKVTLKMASGKQYDIDPATLSEADQTYITQWQKAHETVSSTEALSRPKAESGTSFNGRQWVSAQGKKLSAELLGVKDGKVTLKMANGKKYDIDPATLSEADQTYITQWQKTQGDRIRD